MNYGTSFLVSHADGVFPAVNLPAISVAKIAHLCHFSCIFRLYVCNVRKEKRPSPLYPHQLNVGQRRDSSAIARETGLVNIDLIGGVGGRGDFPEVI